ncbi:hypothetical protein QR685DRAFT_518149, partial [Neurospora intermedia]
MSSRLLFFSRDLFCLFCPLSHSRKSPEQLDLQDLFVIMPRPSGCYRNRTPQTHISFFKPGESVRAMPRITHFINLTRSDCDSRENSRGRGRMDPSEICLLPRNAPSSGDGCRASRSSPRWLKN